MARCDYLVVGAGMAGASVAAHLAETRSVMLIDMEAQAGFHATARSAAVYEPNYGPAAILALTRASKGFFENPPAGFTAAPLLSPRATLMLEADGQAEHTAQLLCFAAGLEEVSETAARRLFPVLRQAYAKRCFVDDHTGDLDVDLIHRGYLRLLSARGGTLLLNTGLHSAERQRGTWRVQCGDVEVSATTIVNAAGAWGDMVAERCGVRPVGLEARRRSIGVVPVAMDSSTWPMVIDVGETWYAKPQGARLLVSSADATPVPACDASADDMAIAEGVERMMQATTLEVTRMESSWGGIRTFAPDGNPVVGYDPSTEGFVWLVGQGGYGIQSAPALSRVAANMARHLAVPQDVIDLGLDTADILPDRCFT
jgi:D-arginine dehydrogenase